MRASSVVDTAVTLGSGVVVAGVVLAVALPVAVGAAIFDLVVGRRPETVVLLWDLPRTLQGPRQ
jgi:hypothetical protein